MYAARAIAPIAALLATLLAALVAAPLAARAATIAETANVVLTSPWEAGQTAVLGFSFDAAGGAVAIGGGWDAASLALADGTSFAVPAYVADGSTAAGFAAYGAGPTPGSYLLALAWTDIASAPNGWRTDFTLTLTARADRPLFAPDGGIDPGFFATALLSGSLIGQSAGLNTALVPARFVETSAALGFANPVAVPEPSTAALLAGAVLACLALLARFPGSLSWRAGFA